MQTQNNKLIWGFLVLSIGIHAALFVAWNNNRTQTTSVQTNMHVKLDAYVTQASTASQPRPQPAKATEAKPAKQTTVKKNTLTTVTRKPAILIAEPQQKPEQQPVVSTLAKQTTPVAVTPTNESTQHKLSTRIQQQLHARLKFFHHYPRIAIRNSWHGQVDLAIRVQANGELGKIYVIQSSGYNLLDKAAIKSVQQVAVLPDAGYWLNGQPIDVILPVIYQLSDNQS